MARSVFRFRPSPSVVAGLLAIVLSIVPLGAAMAQTAATGDEPQLLFRLQAADKADVPPQRGAAAAERVAVDRLLLDREPQRLAFDLLDGRRTALADGLERRGAGDLTWRGWLDEGSDKAIGIGRVVLTLHRGHLVGAIFTAEGTYELAPLPPGPGDGGSVGGTVLKLLDPELR